VRLLSTLSLRWRVTLLAATILIICSCAFTAFSIYNAQQMLYPIIENSSISYSIEDSELGMGVPAIPAQEQKELFDHKSIYFCIIVTILGTVSVWIVSGKALEPINQLNKTIRLIDEHNLSERLEKAKTDDEIGQLTDSFNHMLSRLEEAFERQKRFTASAAHELKTPLATVKAGIQVLDRDENADLQDYKENAGVIVKSVDRLTSVVNGLLMLASAEEGNQNMFESIGLDIMFDAILSDISALYEKSNITYEIDLKENSITGNAGMLYRVFGKMKVSQKVSKKLAPQMA
jgi:signal transduction histidine kinase